MAVNSTMEEHKKCWAVSPQWRSTTSAASRHTRVVPEGLSPQGGVQDVDRASSAMEEDQRAAWRHFIAWCWRGWCSEELKKCYSIARMVPGELTLLPEEVYSWRYV